eukprot:375690_1
MVSSPVAIVEDNASSSRYLKYCIVVLEQSWRRLPGLRPPQAVLKWKFPRSEFGDKLQFYDDYHEEIILINSEAIYKSHKESSKLNKFNIKIPNHTSILNAKFSAQNKYIGLQINSHELQIKNIRGDIIAIQQCRNIKNGNHILNFHWISTKDANVCIVSAQGLELYGFSASNRQMTLTKSIKYSTMSEWYLPSQQFILLVNRSFVFYGIKLGHLNIEKMNKFEIVGIEEADEDKQSNPGARSKSIDIRSNITLIDLSCSATNTSNNIGCIFIDERKTKLYLFKAIRHQMQLTHSYHLYSAGKYAIFHIDNVLVAYNRTTEMPILIDFAGNNYISAPLPITMCYYEGNDPMKPKRIFSTAKHIASSSPAKAHANKYKAPPSAAAPCAPYTIHHKRFEFISPSFILEKWNMSSTESDDEYYFCGHFYRLSLNLDAIVHSWGPERQIPLLHFLLHRATSDSKAIILSMLHDMIKSYCLGYKYDLRSRLDFISEYFVVLNEVLRRAVEESAIIAQNHYQEMLQQQQQLSLQKEKEKAKEKESFSARFRKQSQSYAQKLFGAPPEEIQQMTHANGLLPPPPHHHHPNQNSHNNPFLPAPMHAQQRRVAATVKFDLEKTSKGETVIKTTELLEDILNPIYATLLSEADANNQCLNRFCAVLIEYTRSMHRIRLKLPLSISQLLMKVLKHTQKLYTLHQLFQYHAFPDDEKLACELLDIAATKHYCAGKQLAIDMLLRLGRWSKICQILLNENEIETGVRLFLDKYPFDKKNNIEQIQLSHFLHKAYTMDPIRFYHLYQGLDMIISNNQSIATYYSDYYNKSESTAATTTTKNKNYNTNLKRLFADEMNNFRPRFESLHQRFADDNTTSYNV